MQIIEPGDTVTVRWHRFWGSDIGGNVHYDADLMNAEAEKLREGLKGMWPGATVYIMTTNEYRESHVLEVFSIFRPHPAKVAAPKGPIRIVTAENVRSA